MRPVSDRPPARRYAFIFVCQQGEIELKALLLAGSLRKFLRCNYELIAAIPSPTKDWGTPSDAAFAALQQMEVRTVGIQNEFGREYPIGNKLFCLDVPTDADKVVFIDSDIVALREFADQSRFGVPFNAKPADLQTFSRDESVWRTAYETAGAPFPSMRIPSTVSREFAPPYFNAGFVAVDARIKFARTWQECCRRIQGDARIKNKSIWLDQIGLPLALARLGLTYDCLDERYNYPAHLKPLNLQRLPYFCHYHRPQVLFREPVMRELFDSLIGEYPAIKEVINANPNWMEVMTPKVAQGSVSHSIPKSAPYVRKVRDPNLIITGIPRSGTSYLCNLLHRYSNCVIVNEPAQIFAPLGRETVPWGVARMYAELRSDIREGKPIANKLQDGKVVEDTAGEDVRRSYTPRVENVDFVLGTKNTLTYLPRLKDLRRVMPEVRIVACVRNPYDTIASWKASFSHLRDATLNKIPVGHPDDPCLTGMQAGDLKLIMATLDIAQRRAMWWNYLAERILEQGRSVILVRYPELIADPQPILAEILEDWPKGHLLEEIAPSEIRQKRDQLDAADNQAIRMICSQAAFELGLEDARSTNTSALAPSSAGFV